jgi:hypothetical protein
MKVQSKVTQSQGNQRKIFVIFPYFTNKIKNL